MSTTATLDAPAEFQIAHRGVLLQSPDSDNPYRVRIFGDVARLSNGELWARWPGDSMAWDPSRTTSDPLPWASGSSIEQQIDAALQAGQHQVLPPPEEDPAVAEIERFRRQWPHVAATLGLAEPAKGEAVGLFCAGAVFAPRHYPGDACIDWRAYLARHTAGDWGDYGSHRDTAPTLDELWTREHLDVARRNDVSIHLRSGPVRSRYVLPAGLALPALRQRIGQAPLVAEFLTDLDSARTLVVIKGDWSLSNLESHRGPTLRAFP